jgi:L-rhamnose mutarotase
MAGTEVNARRQSPVAEFFTGVDGRPPDEGLVLLTEVFHLAEEK